MSSTFHDTQAFKHDNRDCDFKIGQFPGWEDILPHSAFGTPEIKLPETDQELLRLIVESGLEVPPVRTLEVLDKLGRYASTVTVSIEARDEAEPTNISAYFSIREEN